MCLGGEGERSGPHVIGAPATHLAFDRVGRHELTAKASLHEADELVVAGVAKSDELLQMKFRDALAELDRQHGGEPEAHLEPDDAVLARLATMPPTIPSATTTSHRFQNVGWRRVTPIVTTTCAIRIGSANM
jgi:hypothetical protein